MPLDAIITVETVEIPKNWITAEQAKSTATSIANAHLVILVDRIMEVIKVASGEGRTSCAVSKNKENNEIIKRALSLLQSLGYEVSNDPYAIHIKW